MSETKVIWQIKDGKRGHENQSDGLVQAIARRTGAEVFAIKTADQPVGWSDFCLRRKINFTTLPVPRLIVGAGSGTHACILVAGRTTGAATVVLMAPPWPVSSWFDLCVVPEHDGRSGHNIITSRGVLNSIRRDPEAEEADRGLFLLGGPSKHHGWDTSATIARVKQILAASPRIKWTATTSRRSPPDVERALTAIEAANFSFVPLAATEGDWVPRQLGRASYAWVTEDSVSMVYEALTAGARVGLLPTPRKRRRSRVIRGVDILLQEGYALPYRDDSVDLAAFDPAPPLNEAERIAKLITARYFSDPPSAPQKQ